MKVLNKNTSFCYEIPKQKYLILWRKLFCYENLKQKYLN
jgi:hypothetical protein